MAERRMFSKSIIDSDVFLDMPLSTQALYFHLAMRADDDGFINNPKRILRTIGATDDEMRLLLAKRYLLSFDSGVVVIKHWRMHNYIQNDRYKETIYLEEKKELILKDNKSYTEMDTRCIQNGDTGKVRIDKIREDKRSENKRFAPPTPEEVDEKQQPPIPPKGGSAAIPFNVVSAARGRHFDFSFITAPEWREVWEDWVKNKKSPYTKQRGVEAGYSKLVTISGGNLETAKKIIENSFAGNWSGLFPIQEEGGKSVHPDPAAKPLFDSIHAKGQEDLIRWGKCRNCGAEHVRTIAGDCGPCYDLRYEGKIK